MKEKVKCHHTAHLKITVPVCSYDICTLKLPRRSKSPDSQLSSNYRTLNSTAVTYSKLMVNLPSTVITAAFEKGFLAISSTWNWDWWHSLGITFLLYIWHNDMLAHKLTDRTLAGTQRQCWLSVRANTNQPPQKHNSALSWFTHISFCYNLPSDWNRS